MKGTITDIKIIKDMEAKLDFSKASISQESNQSLTYYAFIAVHLELIKDGATVDGLRIKFDGVVKDSTAGFREFLMRIASLNYDVERLSKEERATINTIVMYLSESKEADIEPIVGSKKSLSDLIAENMPSNKN